MMTTEIPPLPNAKALARFLDKSPYRFHKVGIFDIDGVFRGKYVNRDKLLSAAQKGFGFCDVVLGWDSEDQLYDAGKVSGWHTGYRDAQVQLDLDSTRRLPSEPNTLLMLGRFVGDHAEVCPRALLGRVAEAARARGLFPRAAAEYEFFLFSETPHSVRTKGYRELTPMTPGMFGYSVIRNSVHAELYHEIIDHMEQMNCEVEGIHTETGPGVIEAALRHCPIEAAADRAGLFKTFTKVIAQRRDLMATFMAKWSNEYPGQSGHLHLSLEDKDGNNLFHDPKHPSGMSELFRHFVAGQVRLLPELLPMVCATTNAYRRLVPGMWAPTHANWGIENRTAAIRVIPAGEHGTRSEYRIAPADANPHLAMAAALASGLWGIEHKLELSAPVVGNGYEQPGAEAVPLASDLLRATDAFEGSEAARQLLGSGFVEHFASTRRFEDQQARAQVTDWELRRYFEII